MMSFFYRYAMYILIGFGLLAVLPIIWIHRQKAEVHTKWEYALLCVLYSALNIVATILFAHVESLIAHGSLANRGAMSSYGFYFFGPLMMIVVSRLMKWNPRGVMDIYALCGIPTFVVLRFNCLRSGCCGGIFLDGIGVYFPTREAEIVFYIIMFFVLWRMLRKNAVPGQLFPLLMTCYGTFRFVNQWFRQTETAGWNIAHTWSVLCVFIGLSLFFEIRAQAAKEQKRKRKTPENRRNKK